MHMQNRHQGTGMEWLIQHGTRHGTRPTRQGMLQAFGSSWCQHHRHRGVASLGIHWLSMEAWIEPTMAINGQTKPTPVANQNRSQLMLKPDCKSRFFPHVRTNFYISTSFHTISTKTGISSTAGCSRSSLPAPGSCDISIALLEPAEVTF